MRRCVFALMLVVATAACFAAEDGRNPALNPVEFLDAPQHAPLTLIRGGEPQFVIAHDGMAEHDPQTGDWRPSAKSSFARAIERSVLRLTEAVESVTGVSPDVVDLSQNEPPAEGLIVYVGPSEPVEALGIDTSTLDREQFVVRTFDRGVAIAGFDGSTVPDFAQPRDRFIQHFRAAGTLWGIEDFIERYLGVRYYYAGIGVVARPIDELVIEPVRYTDQPVYPERVKWNLFHEFGRNGENWPWDAEQFPPDYWDLFDHWRMANSSRFVASHTPLHWPAVHGADKPWMFYEDASGKRYFDTERPSGNVYDVSRRETAEQYIEDVARFYETGWDEPWKGWHHPNDEFIPFGMPDNYVVIENERTADLLNPGLGRFGLMSDVMTRFHLWLAEMAAERWPEKTVTAYAYAHHRLPPTGEWQFPENLLIQQCHFNNIGLMIFPEVAELEESITREWESLLANKPRGYTYWGSYEYPMAIQIPGAVEYFRRIGPHISGTYFDGGGPWSLTHMSFYVAFRLTWDPDFDVDAAMAEYYNLAYGPAAEHVEALYDLWIDRWEGYEFTLDPLAPMAHLDRDQVYGRVYPPEIVAEMKRLLDEATAALPGDSIEAARVQFIRDGLVDFFAQSEMLSELQIQSFELRQIEDTAITIDGELDDPGWPTALRHPFRTVMTADRAKSPSFARVAWSPTALYLSFEMTEHSTWELRRDTEERDGRIWADDCMEVFLSPGTEKDAYFQIVVNAAAAIYDQRTQLLPERKGGAEYDIEGLEAAVSVGDNKWYLEMRIPFADMGVDPPSPGDRWFGNFVRNRVTVPKEVTSFSPTLGNNHDPRYWAPLIFTGPGM